MALQFPDFNPVAVPIPALPVAWLGSQPALLLSGLAAAAAIGTLTWRSRRVAKNGPDEAGDQGDPIGTVAWTFAIVGILALVLHFVVSSFQLDRVGPFAIRWYALAYIAGILLGWRYCVAMVRNARLWGAGPPTLKPPQVDDLIFWVTFAIIFGGRLGYICFYMLVNPDQRAALMADPLEVFEVWKGGMSFHGAAIGVGLAIIGFARANRVSMLGVLDLVAASEPIGQGFGRVANFVNGELWGRPTNLPWGMVFCNSHIEADNAGVCPPEVLMARHPSQLYEAALEGVVLFLVLRFATHRLKWLQRRGAVTGLWLIGYGAIRIALENVRNPDIGMPNFPLGLTMGMILSIPMILVGAGLIWWTRRRAPPPAPAAPQSA